MDEAWEVEHKGECGSMAGVVLQNSVFHQSPYQLLYEQQSAKMQEGRRASVLTVDVLRKRVGRLEGKLQALRKENHTLKAEKVGCKSALSRSKLKKPAKKAKVSVKQQTDVSLGKDDEIVKMQSVSREGFARLDLVRGNELRREKTVEVPGSSRRRSSVFVRMYSKQPGMIDSLHGKSAQEKAHQVMDYLKYVSFVFCQYV